MNASPLIRLAAIGLAVATPIVADVAGKALFNGSLALFDAGARVKAERAQRKAQREQNWNSPASVTIVI